MPFKVEACGSGYTGHMGSNPIQDMVVQPCFSVLCNSRDFERDWFTM